VAGAVVSVELLLVPQLPFTGVGVGVGETTFIVEVFETVPPAPVQVKVYVTGADNAAVTDVPLVPTFEL
jgi:hypothetical protein